MKTLTIIYKPKKSFMGYVSVRSHIIDKVIATGKDLIIEFNKKRMTISASYLTQSFQLHKKKFKSKFNNMEYELYDFKFQPDGEKQTTLI